ncbi:MAG: hypothetical protein BroJett003_26080 [Planctomycetota bacterium]|nr:MAG: hypothetical protein BroJett003_26080 [Planctomycetota bacterium]
MIPCPRENRRGRASGRRPADSAGLADGGLCRYLDMRRYARTGAVRMTVRARVTERAG